MKLMAQHDQTSLLLSRPSSRRAFCGIIINNAKISLIGSIDEYKWPLSHDLSPIIQNVLNSHNTYIKHQSYCWRGCCRITFTEIQRNKHLHPNAGILNPGNAYGYQIFTSGMVIEKWHCRIEDTISKQASKLLLCCKNASIIH